MTHAIASADNRLRIAAFAPQCRSLPDAEPPEQGIEHILGAAAADQAVEREPGEAEVFGGEEGVVGRRGIGEGLTAFVEQAVLALAERDLARCGHRRSGRGDEIGAQRIDAFAGQRRDSVAGIGDRLTIATVALRRDLPGTFR